MYIYIYTLDILDTHTTGWLQVVGSSKLQVSFAKEPYKRDYILQKKPEILKEPTNRSHPIQSTETHLHDTLQHTVTQCNNTLQHTVSQQPTNSIADRHS